MAILNHIQMSNYCFENLEHTLCPSFSLFKESASGLVNLLSRSEEENKFSTTYSYVHVGIRV